MSELTRKASGMWAEENRRGRSSSDSSESDSSSSRVQLPSVRALASRFNSLAQHEGIVVTGVVRPSAGVKQPAKPVPKPTPAPVKTKPPTAKVFESKVQKSSVPSTNDAPLPPKPPVTNSKPPVANSKPPVANSKPPVANSKPPVANSKPRVSVTTDTDDDVFESKKTPTTPEAPAHFPKKPTTGDSKQKTGFSSLPSKSTTKKWSSLSDLHADSSPKQRSDSVSSMTIFGVSLRRLDSISWGVTQARRSTAGDDSNSSSDDESRTTSPDYDKTDAGCKFDTFPKNRPVESVPDKKRSGGGVKSKINQKMVNKDDVKYHSYSDLSTAGVETGATWPRRTAFGVDSPNPPHQTLTRRQSISDLLKLYRSKSQSDLSQAADSKPPPSPKFEPFSRPKTPVPTPLTMYDLKISNPMEKTKVSPYKPPTKDIVRLPPGAVSFAPKKPSLVLAPVPSKDTSLNNNTTVDKSTVQVAPVPNKQAPAQLEKPATKNVSPVETKLPSTTAKQTPGTPKPSPDSLSVSTTVIKTTVNKTLSSSSSNSDSSAQAAPEPKQVITPPKVVYQPPPKHFNRPIYNQTPSVTRPKETAVQKPEQKPKTSSIQSLSRMYTPLSYGKSTASASKNSVAKPDQSQSSSSSDDETNSKSMGQKSLENKPPVKAVASVTSLINTLNDMKAKPTFPVKPDVLKPKPQDPIWVQKVRPVSQSSVESSRESNNTNTKASSGSLNDRNKLGRKYSSTSSASSDAVDGIPHDEKSSSFIVTPFTGAPIPKKRSFKNVSSFTPTPPNTPSAKSVSKPNKLDKLSVADSLNSWVEEVNKKDSSSSSESSDEDDITPEETTGSYDFTTSHSGPSKLPTYRVNDIKKEGTVPNVVLIKFEPIVDRNLAPSQSGKKENGKESLSAFAKVESNGESLPATVSVRKAVKKVERKFSSSSDDGIEKRQSKLSTPVPNTQRKPVHQQNNIDHQSKKNVTFNPVEEKNSKSLYSRQDSVNRKSVSSENSSSGETSTSEPFKEIDPYAIGRMIVRGSRKSTSVVKKPENLTNIRNASVPSHSPFSPLKPPTRKIDSVNTTAPKPKLQKKDSSSDDGKIPPKPQARSINSSNDEQGNYKMTKTKRGNFIRQSLSASSDFDSSDGEKGGLELSIGHDSDHGDGVYSANVAFIE